MTQEELNKLNNTPFQAPNATPIATPVAPTPAVSTPNTPGLVQNTGLVGADGKPVAVPNIAPSPVAAAPAPAPVSAPAAPLATPVQSSNQPYTVSAGDTLSTIAQKFNVPINQITGYRSGDPNKIFPGETLSIGSSNLPAQSPAVSTPQATAPAAPETTSPITDIMQPGQILKEYGIDGNALQYGFQVNPTKTIKDLVTEIMNATGLPDAKGQIETMSKGIEEIQNLRDDEIQAVNDNPFLSASSKDARITLISDKYEKKIANRVNQLKLLQGVYDDARSEAQFAATTAINLFDKNRNFEQGKLEFAMTQAEKALDARNKLHPSFDLSEGQRRYEYNDKTGNYELVAQGAAKKPTSAEIQAGRADANTTKIAGLDTNAPDYFDQVLALSKGGKMPSQVETVRPLQKAVTVVNQLSELSSLIKNTKTDPVVGALRSMNPYDFDARAIQATLQATVPNLARGVYGEVGVLTDNDIKNYIKTLPNIKSTDAQNKFVTGMTLRSLQRGFESQLEVLAASGYDVSGFANIYKRMNDTAAKIESDIGIGGQSSNTPPDDDVMRREFDALKSGGNSKDVNWFQPLSDFFGGLNKSLFK